MDTTTKSFSISHTLSSTGIVVILHPEEYFNEELTDGFLVEEPLCTPLIRRKGKYMEQFTKKDHSTA